jgi:hypothetical protein
MDKERVFQHESVQRMYDRIRQDNLLGHIEAKRSRLGI